MHQAIKEEVMDFCIYKNPGDGILRDSALIYQDWFIANDQLILQDPHPVLWLCWPKLKKR